jgi:hypothetical protein
VGDASDEQYDLFAEGRYIDVKSRVHRDVALLVAKLLGKESPPPASNWSIGALLSKA